MDTSPVQNLKVLALCIAMATGLSACGSGGDGGGSVPDPVAVNSLPTANAGADQSVSLGTSVGAASITDNHGHLDW